MRKILFFINQSDNSRNRKMMHMLAEEFAKQDVEVQICPEDFSIVKGSRGPLPPKGNRTIQKKWKNILKEQMPDYAISFGAHAHYCLLDAASGTNVPVILVLQGNPEKHFANPRQKAISRKYYERAYGMVVQTRDAMEFLSRHLDKKMLVCDGFLEDKYLHTKQVEKRTRRIVCMGNYKENSGQILLAQTFADLLSIYPELQLEFYGHVFSRNAFLQVRTFVEERHLQEKILFKEREGELGETISDAAIFITMDAGCGIPTGLLEAMALQIPVIAQEADYNGAKDVIEDGVNGLLVEDGNRKELMIGLKKYLENPEIVEGFAREAGNISLSYDRETIAKQWLDFLIGD